jgi:hypothetical protein
MIREHDRVALTVPLLDRGFEQLPHADIRRQIVCGDTKPNTR